MRQCIPCTLQSKRKNKGIRCDRFTAQNTLIYLNTLRLIQYDMKDSNNVHRIYVYTEIRLELAVEPENLICLDYGVPKENHPIHRVKNSYILHKILLCRF